MTSQATAQQYEQVTVTRTGSVTEVRFHDGQDGSLVWNATAHREIGDAFHDVAADEDTKVVIITGTGDVFCDQVDHETFRAVSWTTLGLEGRHLLNGLLEIDVPIISAVNGPALIHAELSVLADIVVASTTARFADKAHVVMSQVPGDGSHIVWSRLLGPTRGKYFLLTGQEIDAEEALRLGVVNEVVEPAALLGRAHALAQDLASLPLAMLQATRAVLNIDTRRSFAEDLSHGLALEAFASLSTSGGETYVPKVWNRMAL